MNKMIKWSLSVACAVISAGSVMAQGDGGPLIDALVKKGVLSSQEGEEIRADMTADLASTPGGMISWGSSAVRGVKIYGDARMRYQYENAQDQSPGGNEDRNRYRYRLRLGADYTFAENWRAGVRLETSANSDSTNESFGGYFSKSSDALFVGMVYLEYANSISWLGDGDYTFTMGKHKQPFMITQAFWDGDINPEGISQEIAWDKVFDSDLSVTPRLGAYIIDDENNQGARSAANNDDDFLFVGQTELSYKFGDGSKAKIAPTMMFTTGGVATTTDGDVLTNENSQPYFHHFMVFMLPAEYAFKTGTLKHKIYGAYGINFEGSARLNDRTSALNAYDNASDQSGGNQFFNAGYTLGELKKKGDWTVGGEYRFLEAGSYDANLSDSDFGKNELNQHGFVVNAGYSFTDNISGSLTYFKSWDIDRGIDTGASDNGTVDVLQVDLSWKF
jgi:hypothetical protein